MNLVEKLPLKKGLNSNSIKQKLKRIEQGQRQRRMPMLYELIALCEQDDFVNAVKDYNICPSYFNLRCTCNRNQVPVPQRSSVCQTCWNTAINKSHWRFGGDIIDETITYLNPKMF